MGIVGALAGASVSWRQINLHIKPGDPGYGEPILGLHMYMWALITFVIVLVYCGAMLMLMPKSIPLRLLRGGLYLVSTIIVGLHRARRGERRCDLRSGGLRLVFPDDPTSYHLFDS